MFPYRKASPFKAVPSMTLAITAPHLSGLVADLQSRMPHIAFVQTAALESQQQDAADRQAAIDSVEKTIDEYDNEHPHTGPLHVYMLDGKGAVGMDDESESALRALMHSAINSPTRTIAALMPEDNTVTKKEDLSMSTMLRQLADSVLSTEGVTLLVGKAALEAYLENPSTVNFKQATDGLIDTPVTESLVGVAVIGGLIAAIAGWNKLSANKRKREAGERATDHPLGEGVHTLNEVAFENMAKQFEKTFFDPKWYSAHPLREGRISAGGIAEYLMDGQRVAANPAQSVQKDYAKVTAILRGTEALVNPYLKDLEKLSTEALHHLAEGKQSEDYTRVGKYLEAQMPTIRRPEQRGTIPTAELLGNLKYVPGDWQTVGKFIKSVEPTMPHDIPTMTQPVFDEAVKFLKTIFGSGGANLFQMVSKVYHLTPEYSRAHYSELMDSVDSVTIWRFFGDEYGYEHYGDHGANVGPKVYQGYLYLCLEHLVTEVEALVKWMERSVHAEMPAMEGAGFEIAVTVSALTALSILVHGMNAGIRKLGSLMKSNRKKNYPLIKQEAETLVSAIKRTYLNGPWLDKQVALTTLVSAQGIAEHLVKKSAIPTNLPQAVREHIATIKWWSEHFRSQVTPYMTKVAAIEKELLAKGKSDPDAAAKWAASELAKLKKPWDKIGITTDNLLGNPKFQYEVYPSGEVENELTFHGLPEGASITVLPPLSKVKIPEMADLAVEAFNALTDQKLMERNLPGISSGDDGTFSEELWNAMENVDILPYFWHSDHEREYEFMLWEVQQSLLGISEALTRYIGRSLKHGKDSPL